MKMKSTIPIWFNILLIAYLFLVVFVGQFFDPDADREVPFDMFATQHPAAAVPIAIALVFALLLASAQILRLFWNRLISDLFNIRRLAYQEALSVVLMICFVSSLLFGLN